MKKNVFLVILTTVLLYPQMLIAGEDDSLRRIMNSQGPYKEKIKAFILYGDKFTLKDFDEAIEISSKGLSLGRKNGDSVAVAGLSRNLGVAHYFKGDYDRAAGYFYHSINLLETTAEKRKLALVYNDLAKLYRKTRDLDRAIMHYNKAQAIFTALNDSAGMAMILNESGVVFEYRKDYEEALNRYRSSMKISEALKDSVGISYALNFIAGVFTLQKKFAEAERYLLQTIAIRKVLRDSFALALAYTDAGAMYAAKGNLARAAEQIHRSNAIADPMGYKELLANNYHELANIAERQGNFPLALLYYQKRSALRDSIFNIQKTQQIEELNARYETAKKERTIQEQRFEITKKNYWIGGIVLLLLLGGLLGWSWSRRRKLATEKRLQAAVMKQQELATKAVIEAEENERQRIAKDLHDSVGQMMSAAKMNLSAFESEIRLETEGQKLSLEKIIALVDDSCREVRSVSHNMMPNALLKNSLASAIREFIDKLDHKALQVHLYTAGLDERLDPNTETVLYRVIQECVNNVIKHSSANKLDISVIRDSDGISATIEDNGKGFDPSDKEKWDGIGLKNIRTRIEYLKGTVDVDSTPGSGTLVALHVPLERNF